MNTYFTRAVSTTALAAVLCTATPSCSNMTDDELTRAQASTIGAIGGTAVGAGLGVALSSGSDDPTVKALAIVGGALVGGTIGLFAGKAWGDSIVKAKSEYRTTEAYALANLEQVEKRVSDATRTNNTLRKEIAAAERSGKIAGSRLSIIRQNVRKRQNLIDADLNTAKDSLSGASAETSAKLRQEIAQLEQQRQEIASNLAKLEQYT